MPTEELPIFDAVQLNRHTQRDPNMQIEVLSLFVAEVERLMMQVEDAPDGQVRGDRLRALMGVARNTGASRLAHEARALETQVGDENPDLTGLRDAVAQTLAYVRQRGI